MLSIILMFACEPPEQEENEPYKIENQAEEKAQKAELEPEKPPPPPKPTTHVRSEYIIGKGKKYESPWYEDVGPEPGKAIIVEGGIHGDEIAGTLAIDRLLPKIHILKGRVVWFPRMNKPAFDKKKRFINIVRK